jgi:L-fuculose-phosphate aldolase
VIADERQLQDALGWAGRKLAKAGLVLGSGGNLSARPAGADTCLITAAGAWLDELRPEDFSVLEVATGTLRGGAANPSSERALHLRIYQRRPDVGAVLHLHPQLTVLLSAAGHPIRTITTDHAHYLGRVRTLPYLRPGTDEVAIAAADALGPDVSCVVLGHHGVAVVADSVDLAVKRALNLEEAARATVNALLLGDDVPDCPQTP